VSGKRIGNIKKGFAAACRRARLERVSPHTLRHTAATWLMQAGVPQWQAAGFLAMSEKTLRDVYGHHHPDYLRDAAKALSTPMKFVRVPSA
jgi:integrase